MDKAEAKKIILDILEGRGDFSKEKAEEALGIYLARFAVAVILKRTRGS